MNAVLKPMESAAPELAPLPAPALLAALAQVHFVQIDPPRLPPARCWTNAKGHFVPVEDIPEYEQLREQALRPLVGRWLSAYLDLADLKARMYEEVEALIALCAEQHGVDLGGKKGNVTLYLYDGSFKVERQYQNRSAFDEQINAAEALISKCLETWAGEAGPEIRALVKGAFEKNARGEIRRSEMIRLRSLKIDDDDWRKAMEIIAKAEKILDRACYISVSVRDAQGKYIPLPLDFASVRPHKAGAV